MEGVDDGRPLESASPISAAFGCLCLSRWLHISRLCSAGRQWNHRVSAVPELARRHRNARADAR